MKKNYYIYIITAFIFLLFLGISYAAPLAGDDWGYALNGAKQNPILTAIEFYFSWSGRFFSELTGFILTNNKWLWNILNASLFAGIFFVINKMVNNKYNRVISSLLLLFMMLSVHDYVRMETYTWIMGSANYTIVLFIIILLMYLFKILLFDDRKDYLFYIIIPLNIIGTLMVENASIIILLMNIAVYIYGQLISDRKKQLAGYSVMLFTAIIGFAILRLSPGAYARSLEHASFNNLNIIEMFSSNWYSFLTYTYLNNKYLMLVYTSVGLVYSFIKVKNLKIKIGLVFIFALGMIQSMSSFVYSIVNIEILRFFFDLSYLYADYIISGLLILIILSSLYIINTLDLENKTIAYTALIAAGIGMGSMLISPIIGARNSLFTIYLLMIVVLVLFKEIKINSSIKFVLLMILIGLNFINVKEYVDKYKLVYSINIERASQIEYYQNNPDEKEAWIARYPIFSVHSADIEADNTYHMEVFKAYYGLNPDMDVIFYYKDQY